MGVESSRMSSHANHSMRLSRFEATQWPRGSHEVLGMTEMDERIVEKMPS